MLDVTEKREILESWTGAGGAPVERLGAGGCDPEAGWRARSISAGGPQRAAAGLRSDGEGTASPVRTRLAYSLKPVPPFRLDLADASAEELVDLEALASETDEIALQRLGRLRGVGRWTAEYVLLRGLGRLHVFPGDDVGARNNLRRWLSLSAPLDYDEVGQALARWQGYAGLIYFHLLLDRLAQTGAITVGKTRPQRKGEPNGNDPPQTGL